MEMEKETLTTGDEGSKNGYSSFYRGKKTKLIFSSK